MAYGDIKVVDSWESLGLRINPNSDNTKVLCPLCSANRKAKNQKEKCLSISGIKGVGNCKNCETSFVIKKENMKVYSKPEVIQLPVSAKTIEFFKTRGIEERTLQYFKITESMDWMRGRDKSVDGITRCINFNYYDDDELINVKYRATEKRFKLSTNAKLIFYNLNAIKESEECYIQEGEIDTMTAYQCNVFNCVSVPNGAVKGNSNLEYLDNCILYFKNKKKIVIATDNDEAGTKLQDELIRRLGRQRCWTIKYPEGCKDTNEVLLKYGSKSVKEMYENAIQLPIQGVVEDDEIELGLDDLWQNGYPEGAKIGYKYFDDLMSFMPGELTILTGVPGCLTGDTLVKMNNGTRKRIDQISVGDKILSINEEYRSEEDEVINKWNSGIKKVYSLKTRKGQIIKSTDEHRFLTYDGWKQLKEISIGDFIGVENKIEFKEESILDDKIKLLSLWICDGGKNRTSYSFTSSNYEIIEEVRQMSIKYNFGFNYQGKYQYGLSNIQFNPNEKKYIEKMSYYYRRRDGLNFEDSILKAKEVYKKKNGGSTLNPQQVIKDFGMLGTDTNNLYVPDEIFYQSNNKIAILLSYLFSSDGGVVPGGLEYGSNSKRLCDDIKELLSRFGIISYVYKKNVLYLGEYRIAWRVVINGRKQCEIFSKEIGLKNKQEKLQRYIDSQPNGVSKVYDHVPSSMKKYLPHSDKYYKTNIGVTLNKNDHSKIRFSRELALKIAYHDNNKELINKLDNNVIWDEIIEIEEIGLIETYDIEVKKNHNFIANGIITHNSGKSDWSSQMMVRLAARHHWKCGIFSPENTPKFHSADLAQKFIGEAIVGDKKMNETKKNKAIEFIKHYFKFLKVDEVNCSIDGLIELAEEMVGKFGIKLFLIDPYNYIEHRIPQGYSETQYISELLTKLVNFAKKSGVHVILVAHPTKMQKDKDGNYVVANLYDIAGSANFYNKTFNGMSVYRDNKENLVTVFVQKIKYKFVGKLGMCKFKYDIPTGRYAVDGYEFENELSYFLSKELQAEVEFKQEREIIVEPEQLTDITKLSGIKTSFDDYTVPTETIFKFADNGELKPNTDIETPF